jgi:uncharacterized protein (DUF2267 family)
VVANTLHPQTFKTCSMPHAFWKCRFSTKILSLDRAINNTIQWIDDIQTELGWESREDTYKATKAVLQALRDRLPFEKVVHLCANLPLVMKGMLMDGYDFKEKTAKIRSIEEFDEAVQQHYDVTIRDLIFSEDGKRGFEGT